MRLLNFRFIGSEKITRIAFEKKNNMGMDEYMECSKSDWKLFRNRIAEWQENYMDRLTKEYIKLLSSSENASDKFWKLEERIKKDRKHPGVVIEMSKGNMLYDIVALINHGFICYLHRSRD